MSIRKRAGIRLLLLAVIAAGLGACESGHLGPKPYDPNVSPGIVSFELRLPSDRSFCRQLDECGRFPTGLVVFTASGEPLTISPGWCPNDCSGPCTPPPCPPCGVPGGEKLNGHGHTWQGEIYETSTCGSNAAACVRARFVAPGPYVARMCATPGELTPSDTGTQNCTATGPEECVEVPFVFPGPDVTATLSP
jgi:hypothetical protein